MVITSWDRRATQRPAVWPDQDGAIAPGARFPL